MPPQRQWQVGCVWSVAQHLPEQKRRVFECEKVVDLTKPTSEKNAVRENSVVVVVVMVVVMMECGGGGADTTRVKG